MIYEPPDDHRWHDDAPDPNDRDLEQEETHAMPATPPWNGATLRILPPESRIIFAPRGPVLEVITLGIDAKNFVDLRDTFARWEGWCAVGPISLGEQVLGFRAELSPLAKHLDPIAELMIMLRQTKHPLYTLPWGLAGCYEGPVTW